MVQVGEGAHRYERVPLWPRTPKYWDLGMPTDAAVNSRGEIYILSRNTIHNLTIWDAEGNFIGSWGEGAFSAVPHGIYIPADDTVWIVDRDYHIATHYTAEGEVLKTLGQKHSPSPTCDGRVVQSRPFNMPTNLAVGSNGDIFVADGYGNHKVHRFDSTGRLLFSWGRQGSAPGEFALVHNVYVDSRERVLVCDDENDRVQFFDYEGRFLLQWRMANPSGICIHKDIVYIAELQPFASANCRGSGRVSLRTLDGELITYWNGAGVAGEDLMIGPHDLCVDWEGSIYVCEARGRRISKFVRV